jgi:hypothetical protein
MKKAIGTFMIAVTTLSVVTAGTFINNNKFTIFTKVVSGQTPNNEICCEIIVQATNLPTVFNVTLRNKGKESIYLSERTPPLDFIIEVKNAKGQIVSKTIATKKEGTISLIEGRLVMRIIKPNEERTYSLDIGKMYKLNSGEFVVTFKRMVSLLDGKTAIEIVSKPTKFFVNSKLKKSKK